MPLSPDPLPGNCHPKLRRLFDYWRSIHPEAGKLPGRQHLDPVDVPDLLPWIWMVDIQHDPVRFKYRLLGNEQVLAMGCYPVGQWLDEQHADFMTHPHYGDYVGAAEAALPAFRRGPVSFHSDKRFVTLERLLLPMARDGIHVDMLLAITVYMGLQDPAGPQ